MPCHDDIITRWLDRELGKTTRPNYSRTSSNVWGDDGVLYSYGTHFPLIETLRDKRGNAVGFLLNADNHSVSTRRHQSIAENAVLRTGLPFAAIPFEALRAAGIERNTVQIVDSRPAGHETIPHHVDVRVGDDLPVGWSIRWHEGVSYGYDRETGKPTHKPRWFAEMKRSTDDDYGPRVDVDACDETRVAMFLNAVGCDTRTIDVPPIKLRWNTYRHWLGASLIRARVRDHRWIKCRGDKCDNRWEGATAADDCLCGRRITTRAGQQIEERGENRRVYRWAMFLSDFDQQEPRALYFFCELPKVPRGTEPQTIEQALRDLRPDVVKMADAMGKTVTRQGDIFAVPMPSVDKRTLRKMGATFGTRDGKVEEVMVDAPTVDGGVVQVPRYRQVVPRAQLLGTNHVASQSATLPDGTTFARGTLWHRPSGRDADHVRRKMGDGKTWHLIVKNTVPIGRR